MTRRGGGPTGAKLQAALTMDHGSRRMNLEREENMTEYREKKIRGEVTQLRRIADILEEILKLVKKDMEPKKK